MTDRSSVLVVPILYIVRYCEYVKILRFHFLMMYRRAQIKTAEQDTSVSAPVREFLMSLGEKESDFGHRKRL